MNELGQPGPQHGGFRVQNIAEGIQTKIELIDLLPQSIALSDFVAQDNLLRGLSLVQTQVAALKAGLDDAVLLVGSHEFSVSRTVYALMKTDAAKAKMQPPLRTTLKERGRLGPPNPMASQPHRLPPRS